MTGRFIVLEGIDGCGKSTQIKHLVEWLPNSGLMPEGAALFAPVSLEALPWGARFVNSCSTRQTRRLPLLPPSCCFMPPIGRSTLKP